MLPVNGTKTETRNRKNCPLIINQNLVGAYRTNTKSTSVVTTEYLGYLYVMF